MMDYVMAVPESRFLRVKCKKCKNEQIIFDKACNEVKCLICETVLAKPTGGHAELKTNVIEVLG
ncbi:MAG: 30S ribosomal protein S27e [Candidatus Aenigmarchaeota archaeon]|nr:30S ribosomal protein S27e [Candidatus Aenigmarchaeota archaeon]